MTERARKLRMENDAREGSLVEVQQATRQAFEFARTLRENILNIPARLSAELAAENDGARVYQRLDARAARGARGGRGIVGGAAAPAQTEGNRGMTLELVNTTSGEVITLDDYLAPRAASSRRSASSIARSRRRRKS
jgi:hypothetical protein